MTQILRITSRRAGFRRCGVAHADVATDHARSRWSAEEVDQLKSEPMLIVEEIEVAPAKAAKAPAAESDRKPEPIREDRIRTAMRELDLHDTTLFTGSGKPKAEALQELTGLETISAKERDTLWAEIVAETA